MEKKTGAEADATAAGAPKKRRGRRWPIVAGVLAVVIVAAGAGFWVWHEQPSFCNAICHTPMDPYVEDYYADDPTLLATAHRVADVTCLDCHVPTLSEQMSEGINWVTGNYVYPLEERDTDMLTEARGLDGDEFCLNESCHNLTRDDLVKATSGMEFNPHKAQHGEIECSECHKAHRASVMYCTQCHSEAEVPEGWLTVAEANKLSTAA